MAVCLPPASSTTPTTCWSLAAAAAAPAAASGEVIELWMAFVPGRLRPAMAARPPSSGFTSVSKLTEFDWSAVSSCARSSGYAGKSLASESTCFH